MCGEFSYRDEDGEPLMDFNDIQSDPDEPQQQLLDDEDDTLYDRRERPPTPVYNDSKAKPRKRLVKKSSGKDSGPVDFGLNDDDLGDVGGDYRGEDDMVGLVRDDYSDGGKMNREKGEKRKSVEKKRKVEKGEKRFKVRNSGGGRMKGHEADPEMKEMWDTIAGDNSEVVFSISAFAFFILTLSLRDEFPFHALSSPFFFKCNQ